MSLLGLFRKKKHASASTAKERLQILISHEKHNREGPEFLAEMQLELLNVVKKYVAISDDQVLIRLEQEGDSSFLELNITLPEV